MIKGIDVSKWNVIQDYRKLKEDGVQFAIIKSIYGNGSKESAYDTHVKGFTDAGINILGTYNYVYANTPYKASENAKRWVDIVHDKNSKFCLDWEDSSLPKDEKTVGKIIEAYQKVIDDFGAEMIIYTGKYIYQASMKNFGLKNRFWGARYYKNYEPFTMSQNPAEAYKVQLPNLVGWQYTSSGIVKGCNGRLDLDVWYEDITQPDTKEIFYDRNPFTEPTKNVQLGTLGNDANWVLWYLWRFGLLLDESGQPSTLYINGVIGKDIVPLIKEAQKRLGVVSDGIVGRQTRAVFKKVC